MRKTQQILVVCVKFCKFFHGMTGKLKQLATENGPTQSSSKVANVHSFKIRQKPRRLPSCQGGVPEGRGGFLLIDKDTRRQVRFKGNTPSPFGYSPLAGGDSRL